MNRSLIIIRPTTAMPPAPIAWTTRSPSNSGALVISARPALARTNNSPAATKAGTRPNRSAALPHATTGSAANTTNTATDS